MQKVLITGSNRGIGLGLVKQALANGDMVFAACRTPEDAAELTALGNQYGDKLHLIPLDVSDAVSIKASVDAVKQYTDSLDVLINNAAINPRDKASRLGNLDMDTVSRVLHVNVTGPMIVVQAYHDLLKKGSNSRIVMMSSGMGSISGSSGGSYAYRMSKAAINMAAQSLSVDLRGDGIIVIAMDPGWVQTDMGGPSASITVDTSTSGQWRVINGLSMADTGGYRIYDGGYHQW
ncbi:MAG: SDR family oxidoreductase [Anaerolineaceae bacterium]|nr:SDR family oxidoreductase [Anaerolineaceae bacterium]